MYKVKFRRIIELNIKGKFIDLKEENVVEYLYYLWLKEDFKKHKWTVLKFEFSIQKKPL